MLDEKRYHEAQSIFSDDVRVQTAGGTARGPEAAVEQARRNHTVRTQHVISGVLINLDDDRAEARANASRRAGHAGETHGTLTQSRSETGLA